MGHSVMRRELARVLNALGFGLNPKKLMYKSQKLDFGLHSHLWNWMSSKLRVLLSLALCHVLLLFLLPYMDFMFMIFTIHNARNMILSSPLHSLLLWTCSRVESRARLMPLMIMLCSCSPKEGYHEGEVFVGSLANSPHDKLSPNLNNH